jgi:hypothetical protein
MLYSEMLQPMINGSLELIMDGHLGYARFSPACAVLA